VDHLRRLSRLDRFNDNANRCAARNLLECNRWNHRRITRRLDYERGRQDWCDRFQSLQLHRRLARRSTPHSDRKSSKKIRTSKQKNSPEAVFLFHYLFILFLAFSSNISFLISRRFLVLGERDGFFVPTPVLLFAI